jgi:hypothetical protein
MPPYISLIRLWLIKAGVTMILRSIHSYVIVSAVDAMFSGPETYIFPANEDGQIQDYGELEGSYRGGFDHVTALEGAGYAVK